MTQSVRNRLITPPRSWLLLPLLAASPLFFIGGPSWTAPPVLREAWSQGHMVFFALLVIWLGGRMRLQTPARWAGLTLLVLLVSVVIEAIQSQVGRTASVFDVLRNVIGVWFGLFWSLPGSRQVWVGRLLATCLALWQLQLLGSLGLSHYHRNQQFPLLSDFENPRDMYAWRGNIVRVAGHSQQGDFSLAMQLGPEPFSSARLVYPFPDWRGYTQLSFALYNPDEEPLTLTLRINDQQHYRTGNQYEDRFNRRLTLEPGWNHYDIALADVQQSPKGRLMNMQHIQRLELFASGLSRPRRLYLDHIKVQ